MASVRVAFFPDAFHEANGVARTSRALLAAASRRGVPVLCVHGGSPDQLIVEGADARLELARGRLSFALEHDLRYDLLLWRHRRRVTEAVRAFAADLVHVTGPSDVGQLGACVAHELNLPLVGSWHTNLHEFAACRVKRWLRFIPHAGRRHVTRWVERGSLCALLQFYRLPDVLLAPNLELVELLHHETGTPTFLMRRGVDTTLFSPAKRTVNDGTFRFGFVGRLSREKNVRLLPRLEQALVAATDLPFRFVIVGEGRERPWLERQMHDAVFTGVLHGESLARAYANMDLLVFPSETDTFGNVVQEALASGTPALVSSCGGPKFIVRAGTSGYVASSERDFVELARRAMSDPEAHRRMRVAARRQALGASWDSVLDEVLDAYGAATGLTGARRLNAS